MRYAKKYAADMRLEPMLCNHPLPRPNDNLVGEITSQGSVFVRTFLMMPLCWVKRQDMVELDYVPHA